MIISIEGEEATGKTTIAYSAPLPIVGISFDLGIERALYGAKFNELFKGVDIQVVPYTDTKTGIPANLTGIIIFELPQPIQLDSRVRVGCVELWDRTLKLVSSALTSQHVATVVVDTMTIARRARADAYLQELGRKQLLPVEWGIPNDSIRRIYTLAAGTHKHLAAVHHLTDQYVDVPDGHGGTKSITTGVRIFEGLSNTYRFVDVAVRNVKKKGQVSSHVLKCGYNLSLEDIETPNMTWDKLATQIEDSLGGRIHIGRRANVQVA